MSEILYRLKNNWSSKYPKLSGETFPVLIWRDGPLKLGRQEIKLYKKHTGETLTFWSDPKELRINKRLIEILLGTQGGYGRSGYGFYLT